MEHSKTPSFHSLGFNFHAETNLSFKVIFKYEFGRRYNPKQKTVVIVTE